MLISQEDLASFVNEFDARLEAVKAPAREDFGTERAYDKAYEEVFAKRDSIKEEFDDVLLEKAFAGVDDENMAFAEVQEFVLDHAKSTEYGAHFSGLAREVFELAEIVRAAHAAGKAS